jgi:hypothetical protein
MQVMTAITQCNDPNRDKPEIIPGDFVRVQTQVSTFPGIVVQRDFSEAAVLIFPVTLSAYPDQIASSSYAVNWYSVSRLVK